jgi:hypothetical protein
MPFADIRFPLPALSLLCALGASAQALTIERVELGDSAPGIQAYNLQETADARVFARSQAGFRQSQILVQRRVGKDGARLRRCPSPIRAGAIPTRT